MSLNYRWLDFDNRTEEVQTFMEEAGHSLFGFLTYAMHCGHRDITEETAESFRKRLADYCVLSGTKELKPLLKFHADIIALGGLSTNNTNRTDAAHRKEMLRILSLRSSDLLRAYS